MSCQRKLEAQKVRAVELFLTYGVVDNVAVSQFYKQIPVHSSFWSM